MDTLEDAVRSESMPRVRALLGTPGAVSPQALDYALTVAASNRSLDIATLLLDRGAAVNGPDGADGDAGFFVGPLHQAIFHCNAPLATLLAARGADLNRLLNGRTPLSLAAGSADHMPVLRALLDAGADPTAGGTHFSPLTIAVLAKNEAALRALLAAGADPDHHTQQTASTLHLAAQFSLPRCVDALLVAGADPNLVLFPSPATPLHWALVADTFGAEAVEVVCMLLRAGADPTERAGMNTTPLGVAAAEMRKKGRGRAERVALGAAAALLVAAGDGNAIRELPTPCPGLEAAMAPVWQAAPERLPEIFSRLEPAAQEGVRALLRRSHHHGLPKELRWRLVGEALGDAGRDLGLC